MKLSPLERRRTIVERLTDGSVSVPMLVEEFGVSEITIRRDLSELDREGKLVRVHGGAVANERVAYEFSFKEKESHNREAKEAIGRAAADLVTADSAVFLDTGTTSLAVARALGRVKPRVIVTVNLGVASEFVGRKDIRVLIPGGEVRDISPDLHGEWTIEMLSRVSVDVAFLGCDGVDPDDGYYAVDPTAAAVSRLMVERSHRAYLIADSSKFGRRSLCRINALDPLTGIVTDSAIPEDLAQQVRERDIELVIAPIEGGTAP